MSVLKEKAMAAVWTGKNTMEMISLPIPRADENGLVIKVDVAAICGTDGHLFPQQPPYPAILGHEVTGTIVDVGANANRTMNVYGGPVKTGDRIAIYPWITCGKCQGCITFGSGTCTVCEQSFVYGVPYEKLGLGEVGGISSDSNIYPHFKGGFAEYMYVFPETYMWKLPEDMPPEVAVLLDPLAVAVRAVELALTCPGVMEEAFTTNSSVAIIGAGPVGILAALVSRLMGVERIILVGGRKERSERASKLVHIDNVISTYDMSSEDRIKEVKRLTGGRGADVVLQCANTPEAFVDGLEMIRRLGTLIEVGNMVNTGSYVQIDPARQICGKHARIIGMSANNPGAFNKAFHILKRHKTINFTDIYSHVANLENLGGTLLKMKDKDYVKGLVQIK